MPIQRIVCFNFKPETPEAAVQQHMQDFAGMQEFIPQILEYRGGPTQPGDYNSPPEFAAMHYMTFASMADVDIYFYHEAHQRFIQRNKESWTNVLVLNSEY
jgi:hypothetical protein